MYEITRSGYAIDIYMFYRLCLCQLDVLLEDLLHTIHQNFSIVRNLVRDLSHFEFGAVFVTLTGTSDLKHFVGDVYHFCKQ